MIPKRNVPLFVSVKQSFTIVLFLPNIHYVGLHLVIIHVTFV